MALLISLEYLSYHLYFHRLNNPHRLNEIIHKNTVFLGSTLLQTFDNLKY